MKVLLVNDSDLIVFHVFKNLTIPAMVIVLSLEGIYGRGDSNPQPRVVHEKAEYAETYSHAPV